MVKKKKLLKKKKLSFSSKKKKKSGLIMGNLWSSMKHNLMAPDVTTEKGRRMVQNSQQSGKSYLIVNTDPNAIVDANENSSSSEDDPINSTTTDPDKGPQNLNLIVG